MSKEIELYTSLTSLTTLSAVCFIHRDWRSSLTQKLYPLNVFTARSGVQTETGDEFFKFSFNKKLESITRNITLKLVSLPSLRFCR